MSGHFVHCKRERQCIDYICLHGALLTKNSFKPIGAYKCFLKPDVYDNPWHPASGQKNFRQYMKNMLKTFSHPETLNTNFIENV